MDLLRDINLHRNKDLDGTMKALTNTDYVVSGCIPLGELIAGMARHDSVALLNGVQTLAGYALNTVVTYGLKYSIDRDRPAVVNGQLQPYMDYGSHSFPSGHTSNAFSAATSLSLCYPKWYVIVPSYLWASAVGYSRLHLGIHYPTDVLAGAIIGAGTSWLTYKGTKWLQRRRWMPLHYLAL